MARLITSLDHYDRDRATPEEQEAYRVSHEVLHQRMNRLLQHNDTQKRMATPVTDAFGRPLRQNCFG